VSWGTNADSVPDRTIVQALGIAREAGVPIGEIKSSNSARSASCCTESGAAFLFVLAPPTEFADGEYGSYYDLDTKADLDRVMVTLEKLQTGTGRFRVRVADTMVRSDEQIIGVIAHEVHELLALEAKFAKNGGRMTLGMLHSLTRVDRGTLHCEAWDYSDELVRKHRG